MRLGTSSTAIAIVVVTSLALGLPSVASADDDTRSGFRTMIDRIDLEPATITGSRLRVYLSALTIGGQLLDLSDPKSIRLFVGGSEKKVAYSLGTYGATTADTAIVFVIENTQVFAEMQPVILEALDTKLLAELSDHGTQVALMPYGETTGAGKLISLKAARAKIMQLPNDNSAGDPALLDTVEKALSVLKRARAETAATTEDGPTTTRPLRKMIVIVGDGRDRSGDRERVIRLGKRAAKEGVRIHALAFAPADVRKPLLLLGELARQSLGTFRWVRGAKIDSWAPNVTQLRDEIVRQNVITYYLAADDEVANRKLKIVTGGRTETTSNEMKIPDLGCGGQPCDGGYCASDRCLIPAAAESRGVFGWLLLIGGIGLCGVVLLGTIGWVMSKRATPIPFPTGVPAPGVAVRGAELPPPTGPAIKPAKPAKAVKFKPKPAVLAGAVGPAAAAAPVGGAVLFVMTGPRAGERVVLKHGFMIGKAPGSDLVIDDGYASTQHAQIGMDQFGNCRLYDRGSTNGTLCNGVRVTEYVLQHGVVIQIGSIQLRFLAQ